MSRTAGAGPVLRLTRGPPGQACGWGFLGPGSRCPHKDEARGRAPPSAANEVAVRVQEGSTPVPRHTWVHVLDVVGAGVPSMPRGPDSRVRATAARPVAAMVTGQDAQGGPARPTGSPQRGARCLARPFEAIAFDDDDQPRPGRISEIAVIAPSPRQRQGRAAAAGRSPGPGAGRREHGAAPGAGRIRASLAEVDRASRARPRPRELRVAGRVVVDDDGRSPLLSRRLRRAGSAPPSAGPGTEFPFSYPPLCPRRHGWPSGGPLRAARVRADDMERPHRLGQVLGSPGLLWTARLGAGARLLPGAAARLGARARLPRAGIASQGVRIGYG